TGRWRSEGTETSLALLVLKTRQIDNLLAFYRIIGIELAEEQHGKGPLHYAGRLDETVFELYPTTDAETVDCTTRLGFCVSKMAETVEALRSVGTPIVGEPKATEWGKRAVVRDPDGRVIELYQRENL